MWENRITKFVIIASILALSILLTVTGISSILDLWKFSTLSSHWLLPMVITPLIAGICAVVCYLLYSVITDLFTEKLPKDLPKEYRG